MIIMAMIIMMTTTNDGDNDDDDDDDDDNVDDDIDDYNDDFNLFSAEADEATLALYIDKYQALTLSTKVALNH